MKKVSEKYTYIWTILSGIPFGIGMLVGAFILFNDIPKIELQSFKGYVTAFEETTRKSETSNDQLPVYAIQFSDKEYFSEIGKRKNILREYVPIAYKEKRIVTVWTEKNSSSIEQLAIDNQIVLPYKPPYWQAWTFLIIGIVFTGMGTIYLIKYFKSTW